MVVTNAVAACRFLTKRDANAILNLAAIVVSVRRLAKNAAAKTKPKKIKRTSVDFCPEPNQ